ncbi:ATP-binding cassette domain-containing protein [Methanosarcina sp. DH2]|uniref:ABC transporter ATP-binding protein n=1 Tax=Methanosarcina sp. DH2 TaxID=2605639 RepID=UPI001E4D723E|nr:ABC transporter ATP-binding protein [Methanosarcina sp. DH2]MCC4770130.1 ATP-binding cassette domain-containing protein [Methanosarcina sp. DH2]
MKAHFTKTLLEVRDLEVSFKGIKTITALSGISFSIGESETLALVGETGCGKSVVAHAIVRLLPPESRVKGIVELVGKSLLELSEKEIAKIRGKEIGIVFQNPSLALNPVYSIGHQLAEPLRVHRKEKKKEAISKAATVLKNMGFVNVAEWISYYPSWCSGGMNQRFLIAASTMLDPILLIADEPGKGLDRKCITELEIELKKLKGEKKTAMLLISHDLGFVQRLADRVAVMYAGEVVELAESSIFFERPLHPYSKGLLNSLPENGFVPIPGFSPPLSDPPSGCKFHPRCSLRKKSCTERHPELKEIDERSVRCFLYP